MLICHCRAVTDQVIRGHIEAGVRAECDLARRSGAGGRCGGCLPFLRRMLEEYEGPDDAVDLGCEVLAGV